MKVDDEHIAIKHLSTDLLKRRFWSREQLLAHQQVSLRAMLRYAVDHSTYYRDSIGPLVDGQVPFREYPVLTKSELVRNFDRIVTDGRIKLTDTEAHLASENAGRALFGEYRVCATGGTSGERAVVVYDRSVWAAGIANLLRFLEIGGIKSNSRTIGIGASSPQHLSNQVYDFLMRDSVAPRLFVTMPIADVVAALNGFQPDVIITYPSYIRRLVDEQRQGRLRIQPSLLGSVAESLAPELRELAGEVWGIDITNRYNSTESFCVSMECKHFAGPHIPEDLLIYEAVDDRNRPVPNGVLGAKLLLTTLTNRVFPLIRYELSDVVRITDSPCACGMPFARISEIQGRQEEYLALPGMNGDTVKLHAGQLRSPLIKMAGLRQYQFSLAPRGLEINVVMHERVDSASIAAQVRSEIAAVLTQNGVENVLVTVNLVDVIPRSGSGEKERLVAHPAPLH
ncbi:MAG: phenylacetate--CoA ligase family protein [Rhizobiales bacterium]|nr:phenylacetate--CoA ligase family protein [Hyphomicrobiales bacterium]